MTRCLLTVVMSLLLAACGEDPNALPPEPPAWFKGSDEQRREAARLGIPVAWENDIGMRFVLIPAGSFTMGSPESEHARHEDEQLRTVQVERHFYIHTTETTNSQYTRFRPVHDSGNMISGVDQLPGDAPDQPVIKVSWDDAMSFCRWLSDRDPRHHYRLPTEAEWEYACRAGTKTPFSTGETISVKDANWNGYGLYLPTDRSASAPNRTVNAGTYSPNPWGLYDMHGNVWEWCADELVHPWGRQRALRGGSWLNASWQARSANRWSAYADYAIDFIGFRVVASLQSK